MDISVVVHTYNSENFIRRCLESVKDFDEIIVCDMYSTDRTRAIANEYGCKIIMHPKHSIPEPARAEAVRNANMEWVLVVDSDELVTPALKDYLYRRIHERNCPNALWIPRKNYFMQRFMRASFPDYQFRFFRRNSFTGWPEHVHSHAIITGQTGKAPRKKELALIHLESNGVSQTIIKLNKYSSLELERAARKKASSLSLVFKPAYVFLHLYFLKGGILDGKPGLIHAQLKACYKYLTLAKIMETNYLSSSIPKDL